MSNAGLPFGYEWNSDLARPHNNMGHAVYVTYPTALHLAIHLASTTCNVALGALRGYLWAAPRKQCLWTSLLWSATALEDTSEKKPTAPLGCCLCIGTARVVCLLSVRASVCALTSWMTFLSKLYWEAAQARAWQRSHKQECSCVWFLKWKTCFLLFPEEWDMPPKSSEGPIDSCSWCYC